MSGTGAAVFAIADSDSHANSYRYAQGNTEAASDPAVAPHALAESSIRAAKPQSH